LHWHRIASSVLRDSGPKLLGYMLKPNLIFSHKKSTAFSTNKFMKLINIRHYYQHKAYKEIYENQTINVEDVFEHAYIHIITQE
jgi:hypothetical protein